MTCSEVMTAFDECMKDVCSVPERYAECPERDFIRCRKLPAETVLNLLVFLRSDTTKNAMFDFFDAHGPFARLKDRAAFPYESALVQQRKKLKPEGVEMLLQAFTDRLTAQMDKEQHRMFDELVPLAGDGTSFRYESSLTYSDAAYQHKGGGTGWFEQKLTALYNLEREQFTDGIVRGVTGGSEQQDMCRLVDRQARPQDGRKYLYILDRAYGTFNLLAHIQENGDYYLVRMKDIGSNGIASGVNIEKDLLNSGAPVDIDVTFRIGRSLPVTQELPEHVYNHNIGLYTAFDFFGPGDFPVYTLKTRLVRIQLPTGEYELLLTNLPRDKYSAEQIGSMYNLRWNEEVGFRDIKYTLGALSFHAKIDKLVTQEIWASLIAFNMTSAIINGLPHPGTENELGSCPATSQQGPQQPERDDIPDNTTLSGVRAELNFNYAAHVVRRQLVRRTISDEMMVREIRKYAQKVILGRHTARDPHHTRRRFYLNYRSA